MKDKSLSIRAHLAMVLFSLLVAGSCSVGGQIAHLVDPAALMATRFLGAGFLIGLIAFATTKFKLIYFQAPWRFFILGGLLATFFVTMFRALEITTPLSTSAVFTLIPFMTTIFGTLILRQRGSLPLVLALGVGMIGALWIIFRGDLNALLSFDVGYGEKLFFIGCAAYALYTPMARKLNRGEPTAYYMFAAVVAGLILLTIVGWQGLASTQWSTLPISLWAGLAYLIVGATVATFLLLQFSTMQLNSANVMAYTFLVPTWVLAWDFALVGHVPPQQAVLGAAITACAMIVLFALDTKQNG